MQMQHEYDLQRQEAVRFYPCVVPMCGGVAPALLFCWYEQVHREAGYPATGVLRSTLREWRTGLGYTAKQPWYKHFYKIGTVFLGSTKFRAARLARREFVSSITGAYVFFALEVTRHGGPCILHRNAPLIESRIALLLGARLHAPVVKELLGAKARASEDAAAFTAALEKR